MPEVGIAPGFRGRLVMSDLLTSAGILMAPVMEAHLRRNGLLFRVQDDNFSFAFAVQDYSLVLQRQDVVLNLQLANLPNDGAL